MKTITVATLVDVVGVLSGDTLSKNIYLLDNNKENGSSDEGTEWLKTKVSKGDMVIWSALSIEPEAFSSITDIIIDSNFCEPEEKEFEGTDVTYWIGKVKKNLKSVPYQLKIKVGTSDHEFVMESTPCLVGD